MTALSDFKQKHAKNLPEPAVENFVVLIEALEYLNTEGCCQTTEVSIVRFLLPVYNMQKAVDLERNKSSIPVQGPEVMRSVRVFVRQNKTNNLGLDRSLIRER